MVRSTREFVEALGKLPAVPDDSVKAMAARLKKYEEAEQINRRALNVREKVLGTEHPDTLTSVGILASVLQNQGRAGILAYCRLCTRM